MNCDSIARAYRWMEYIVFGRALERCRTRFLSSIDQAERVLMLGDGDGRFLASYLRANPHGRVDCVDASREMLRLARERAAKIPGALDRVRFIHADARDLLPDAAYDLIVTHFFLDCLAEAEVKALASRFAHPDTRWLNSEFRIPDGPIASTVGSALIRVMYQFFSATTGLQTRCLPCHRDILTRQGFRLQQEMRSLKGLLVSELWTAEIN